MATYNAREDRLRVKNINESDEYTIKEPSIDNILLEAISNEKGDVELVDYLINKGANVNTKDINRWSLLHYASKWDEHPDIINLLVRTGARINAKNAYGCTPLHIAITNYLDSTSNILELLKLRADPNIQDNDGNTPLHIVAYRDMLPVIAYELMNHGAVPYIKNKWGKTPIDLAYSHNMLNTLSADNFDSCIDEYYYKGD